MSKLLLLFTLFSSVCFSQMDTLIHDGLERTFLVYTPPAYQGDSAVSLVIAMHGGFGSASNMESKSQLSLKADTANFIVVYPEGVADGTLGIRAWNAGWCCGYPSNNNIDDVGFIDLLIDTLLARYNIDSTRIYATGMSNGGFMSYRLACELSHRIAAIAPVAASMSMPSCTPSRPVPIISFHSYQDGNVPYNGGIGSGPSNHWNSPQDSVMNVWSIKNECQNQRDTIRADAQFTEIHWNMCSCESEMIAIVTEDGGHSWPGGPGGIVGGMPSQVVNADYRMWNFFQNHTLPCETQASLEQYEKTEIFLYPNPVENVLKLNIDLGYGRIVDPLGRVLWEGKLGNEIPVDFLKRGSYFLQTDSHNLRFEK